MNAEIILKYFPELSGEQIDKFNMMESMYKEWNQKINVVSRNDIDNLILHHILHSLTLLKFYNFKPKGEILDLGTGGGFREYL
ncbi:MAG: RsmG family class I SAM-dependent methyltransferase [Saprospiraceae bacterium]